MKQSYAARIAVVHRTATHLGRVILRRVATSNVAAVAEPSRALEQACRRVLGARTKMPGARTRSISGYLHLARKSDAAPSAAD